jgi:hypothetical protein
MPAFPTTAALIRWLGVVREWLAERAVGLPESSLPIWLLLRLIVFAPTTILELLARPEQV